MSNIILASQSAARRAMLYQAGVEFNTIPADLEEESFHDTHKNAADLSLILAQEKARYVSKENKNHYIIGSDQVLEMNNIIFSKAKNKQEAIERLKEFSGQTHILHSSVAVIKNGKILFTHTDAVQMVMKNLSDEQLNNYVEQAGDALTSCVGCYAIEAAGIRLFKEIKGDYFTILGMPLLPLLNYLEREGAI